MLRINKMPTVLSALAASLLVATPVSAEWGLNLPTPVTPIGEEILGLHNMILLICVIIFLGVFAVMFYSVYAHRKSKKYQAAQFSHSTFAEFLWTIIPVFILIGMAIPATATLISMEDTAEADLTVKVTGYQWKWHYDYIDSGVNFYSNLGTDRAEILNQKDKGENYLLEVDTELVLPVGRKIRFLVTANDVIHSWWIPQLAVKKDAIPGYINEIWTKINKPGVYRGQCAELCGKDHGFMPIVVRAVPEQEFDAWVAENKPKEDQAEATPVAPDGAALTQNADTTGGAGELASAVQ
jgi:cytochrome c oxidase subunit 2